MRPSAVEAGSRERGALIELILAYRWLLLAGRVRPACGRAARNEQPPKLYLRDRGTKTGAPVDSGKGRVYLGVGRGTPPRAFNPPRRACSPGPVGLA